MKKILVTGGAGFIGSHVVDAYIEAGHHVAVVDNLSSGFRNFVNPNATFYEVDIRSDDLANVFENEKPDIVSHLAAQIDVRRSVEEPAFDADVNIRGSLNVLECCRNHGVNKILFASTGGAIYGEPEKLPVSEDYWPRPICHYGAAKYSVEHYIYLYRHLYGLDFTILRFPNVYGPRQNPHGEAGVCSILIGLMLEGRAPTLYGFGKPLRDYVFAGDIARACVLALDKGSGETLNLGSGIGTSVREIFDALREIIGFPHEPVLKELRPGEIHQIYITGDRAYEVLDWSPKMGLKDGLQATVDHIRSAAAPS
jgi:UDP-glucose 4-epimerase